jgi:hypothetical protein
MLMSINVLVVASNSSTLSTGGFKFVAVDMLVERERNFIAHVVHPVRRLRNTHDTGRLAVYAALDDVGKAGFVAGIAGAHRPGVDFVGAVAEAGLFPRNNW